jgi:hypothetical protein
MTNTMLCNVKESGNAHFINLKNEELNIFIKCLNTMESQCVCNIDISDGLLFGRIKNSLKRRTVYNNQYMQYYDELSQICKRFLRTGIFNKEYLYSYDSEECAIGILELLIPEVLILRNIDDKRHIIDGIYHFNSDLDIEDFLLMFKPKYHGIIMDEVDFLHPHLNVSEQLFKSLLKLDSMLTN